MCFMTGRPWYYEEKILEHGRNEKLAHTYLDTYTNGERVDSKLIRKSRYKGKPRIVAYERKMCDLPPPLLI